MIIKSVLTPFLFGLVGIFAFAPFSIEFLIFVSYIYLINELISHKKASFLRILLWGIGHWGFGMSWIIVSVYYCLLYTSPSPRDRTRSRMPSSA